MVVRPVAWLITEFPSQTGTRTMTAPAAIQTGVAAPANGKLSGDVTFNIAITHGMVADSPIAIKVTQASTTDRYAHLFDDPLRQATERAGAILSGKPSAQVVPLKGRSG